MKGLITTLNSKFTHSSLSVRYLEKYLKSLGYAIELEEYTINNKIDYIISEIYKGQYDVVTFSCYIWNISETLRICSGLRKVCKDLTIILGGPEVSYNPEETLRENPSVDFIVSGEGELSFSNLYMALVDGKGYENIKGISYRKDDDVVVNQDQEMINDLDTVPFPYDEDLEGLDNRILYYESSRGCPYNCQYCLSSGFKGVRYFSLERVKKDMLFFLGKKVKQVKFVDRTFNAHKHHYFEILKFLKEHDNGTTNFHFEITGSLLDDEVVAFLEGVPEGLFQFEVGVQSTNDDTITAIKRNVEFEDISRNVIKISSYKNIHLHLDLIVGLPFETFQVFQRSFDQVYALKPEKLQMGFLKLLKGSGLWFDQEKYGYVFSEEPPYEIYHNRYISFDEVLIYKEVEELVESYYNSHRFDHSIEYLIGAEYDNSPIAFYLEFYQYWMDAGLHHVSHKSNTLYKILLDFFRSKNFKNYSFFEDVLKYDYYKNHNKQIYGLFKAWEIDGFTNACHEFLKLDGNVQQYVPLMLGKPAKAIIKKVHFEHFEYDIKSIIDNGYNIIEEKGTVILFNYELEKKVFNRSLNYTVEIEVTQ